MYIPSQAVFITETEFRAVLNLLFVAGSFARAIVGGDNNSSRGAAVCLDAIYVTATLAELQINHTVLHKNYFTR